MSSNHANSQLITPNKLHRGRQKGRQRFHGSGALRFNHHHHHNRKHFPVSSFGLNRPDFPLRQHDQEQMFLSQHVPPELRLQNHSRTPPPLV